MNNTPQEIIADHLSLLQNGADWSVSLSGRWDECEPKMIQSIFNNVLWTYFNSDILFLVFFLTPPHMIVQSSAPSCFLLPGWEQKSIHSLFHKKDPDLEGQPQSSALVQSFPIFWIHLITNANDFPFPLPIKFTPFINLTPSDAASTIKLDIRYWYRVL